jgi:tRNA threonylcarbamoyladenosine biosynthesis protein TsaB
MNYFLAVQATYQQLEIGLFKDHQLLSLIKEDKKRASAMIIEHLNAVLQNNDVQLGDLSFIAVNQGPAPFTSLRVVIATVNGIAFAKEIPLVGIDGLAAFMQEHQSPEWPVTVGLINAFNKDIYFAIAQSDQPLEMGCKNIETFLNELNEQFPNQQLRFIGNGTELFQQELIHVFPNAFIPEPLPEYLSINYLGLLGAAKWEQGITSNQLLPLHLKRLRYRMAVAS